MKTFIHYFPVVLLLTVVSGLFVACGGDDDATGGGSGTDTTPVVNNNRNNAAGYPERAGLEFPRIMGDANEQILVKRVTDASDLVNYKNGISYCIGYDLKYKLPRYVCYKMYNSNSSENVGRWYASEGEYQYPEDTEITSTYRLQNSADPYWNTGYDHGHMIPSAHRLSSSAANKQTFLLSNMMPQVNGFNAKVWANMENHIRNTWNKARFRDTLYVVTGGSYQKDEYVLGYIGSTSKGNRIPVPKYYWKAVLCKNASGYKALGFWIEHKSNDDTVLKNYVVNIDQLEQLTGLDFFCNLPDNIENTIEAVPAATVATSFGFN